MDTATATGPETAPAHKTSFLINRNFALLWSGQAVSQLGDFAFYTTLTLWVGAIIGRGQSWAPLAVSGSMMALLIPIVVIGPLAGVFVDRWDKRRTMITMDMLRATLIALLLVVSVVPLPFGPGGRLPIAWQLGAIYAVVFLTSACAQFFNPSQMALIGDIVDERVRARASGMSQMTFAFAILVAPPLAAPVLFAFGVQWALLLDALSFVVSFLSILAMRVPRQAESQAATPRQPFLREFAEGLRFFGRSRVLMTILLAGVVALLGAGALNALDLFFVTQNLHTSASFYGFLGAASGAGGLLGAVLGGLFAQRIGVARMLWLALIALGMSIVVYARLTSFAPALVVNLLVGFSNGPVNVAVDPLILHVTKREFVGRVMAVLLPAINLASIVSMALAGLLASTLLHGFHATLLGITFGPIDTIFVGSGILVILGGLYAMLNLRGVHLAGERGYIEPPAEVAAEPEAVAVSE
ncbi:MAG TPA: MFS transporter [Ktedonobacterales bacterium]|nr:MFS transporter [Ktedonobacterales bacterium]